MITITGASKSNSGFRRIGDVISTESGVTDISLQSTNTVLVDSKMLKRNHNINIDWSNDIYDDCVPTVLDVKLYGAGGTSGGGEHWEVTSPQGTLKPLISPDNFLVIAKNVATLTGYRTATLSTDTVKLSVSELKKTVEVIGQAPASWTTNTTDGMLTTVLDVKNYIFSKETPPDGKSLTYNTSNQLTMMYVTENSDIWSYAPIDRSDNTAVEFARRSGKSRGGILIEPETRKASLYESYEDNGKASLSVVCDSYAKTISAYCDAIDWTSTLGGRSVVTKDDIKTLPDGTSIIVNDEGKFEAVALIDIDNITIKKDADDKFYVPYFTDTLTKWSFVPITQSLNTVVDMTYVSGDTKGSIEFNPTIQGLYLKQYNAANPNQYASLNIECNATKRLVSVYGDRITWTSSADPGAVVSKIDILTIPDEVSLRINPATAKLETVNKPDGATIRFDASDNYSVITDGLEKGSTYNFGVVKADGTTLNAVGGVISANRGSDTSFGVFKTDNLTIVANQDGVLSSPYIVNTEASWGIVPQLLTRSTAVKFSYTDTVSSSKSELEYLTVDNVINLTQTNPYNSSGAAGLKIDCNNDYKCVSIASDLIDWGATTIRTNAIVSKQDVINLPDNMSIQINKTTGHLETVQKGRMLLFLKKDTSPETIIEPNKFADVVFNIPDGVTDYECFTTIQDNSGMVCLGDSDKGLKRFTQTLINAGSKQATVTLSISIFTY